MHARMPVKVCECMLLAGAPTYLNRRLFADSDTHEAPTFSPIKDAQVTVDCFA